MGEQSLSKIHVQPWKPGSVVVAQGAAYDTVGYHTRSDGSFFEARVIELVKDKAI
jgi:hypothetical protein